jgi:hypothetical protein
MEKSIDPQYINYQRKIISYIDGSLSSDEKAEFEAFARTNPQIEKQIKQKEDELLLIKSLIPAAVMSKETVESLENEMKNSVSNLLKKEPKNFLDEIKEKFEDWVNR